MRKALLASVTAVALTGGVYGYSRLTDGTLAIPGLGGAAPAAEAAPVALTLTPTEAPTAAALEQAQGLYAQALDAAAGSDLPYHLAPLVFWPLFHTCVARIRTDDILFAMQ